MTYVLRDSKYDLKIKKMFILTLNKSQILINFSDRVRFSSSY
jgi:hypothetical protein